MLEAKTLTRSNLLVSIFSNFPGGACSQTPQKHATHSLALPDRFFRLSRGMLTPLYIDYVTRLLFRHHKDKRKRRSGNARDYATHAECASHYI